MRTIYTLLVVSYWLVLNLPAFAQSKGFKPIVGGSAPTGTERRLALVVGNTHYSRPGASLTNPTNDADDMSKALDGLGFDVIEKKDLDRVSFEKAINEFGRQLKNYDVGLVYYSGHGLQYQGENFLVPTDEDMSGEPDIPYHCVNLGRILAAMEGSNAQTNILLLDACRNNPFPKSSRGVVSGGLTIPRNPAGTFVAFATSENSTADDNAGQRNGLFTGELLKHLSQPNRSLSQILTETRKGVYERSRNAQTPADYNKLLGDFVFVQTVGSPTNVSPIAVNEPVKPVSPPETKTERVVTQEDSKPAVNLAQVEIARGKQAYVDKDFTTAFRLLSPHADLLDAEAQTDLGYMYSEGKGVEKDYQQAISWYRRAVVQGYARGQNNLGYMYQTGQGVEKDYQQAVSWYRKAAEQGNAMGKSNLGTMYRDGNGVEQDFKQAVSWYRKAAEQGYAAGQNNLGTMYRDGNGVKHDYQQAVSWYRKAAEQGDATGQSNLGTMYANGLGVKQDYQQAVSWYRKAAEQGYAYGQCSLGILYEKGLGVELNLPTAISYYQLAARQGNEYAQNALQRLGKTW